MYLKWKTEAKKAFKEQEGRKNNKNNILEILKMFFKIRQSYEQSTGG